MAFAEDQARSRGLNRLRLDTAVPAEHLVNLCRSHGYREVAEVQWGGKTYRSYIMEKLIEPATP